MSSPDPLLYGGPWYVFPLAVFLSLTILIILPVAGLLLYDWVRDRKGYKWLVNNSDNNALVLTWLNHANNVEELSHRSSVLKDAPVANFLIAEKETEAIEIARKYKADYVLVAYPSDVREFGIIALAAGKNSDDYITSNITIERIARRDVIKKETVGLKMIYGEEIDGFEKVFDNKRIRIYKLAFVPPLHRNNDRLRVPNTYPTS